MTELDLKLRIRRRYLRRYHASGEYSVVDACAGHRRVWNRLRRTKPRPAVCTSLDRDASTEPDLVVDSGRYLARASALPDVLDIDSTAYPWAIWRALMDRPEPPRQPVTIFLTYVRLRGIATATRRRALSDLGIQTDAPDCAIEALPGRFELLVATRIDAPAHGWRVVDASAIVDAPGTDRWSPVRVYAGMRCEPCDWTTE